MNYEEKILGFMDETGLIAKEGIKKQLLHKIEIERENEIRITLDGILSSVKKGFYEQAALDFVLMTKPYEFIDLIKQIRKNFDSFFPSSNISSRINLVLLLISVTLNLKSHLAC